mgnify:CR=1 FL=1
MKRFLSLLMAAVVLCSLCVPAFASDENITLEFWEMTYGSDDRYTETCEKLIAAYEAENPGVTINMTYQPWDNYYQLFLTAVSSGAAPDVASCALDQPDLFAQMDEIQYLDDVIGAWKEEGIYEDYTEDMLNFFKYEGNQIAIPYMVGYRGFFYRADYLKEAGVEKVPETWEELLDACAKLRDWNPEIVPLALTGATNGIWHCFMSFAFSNAVGIVDEEMRPTSETQPFKETIDLFQTLREQGYVAEGVLGHDDAAVETLYFGGKAAFFFGSFGRKIFDYPEVAENTEILSCFQGPSSDAIGTLSFPDALVVFSQTKHPEESLKFIKWWAENTQPLFTEGGCWAYPAKASFFSGEIFADKVSQGVLNEVLPTARTATWPIQGMFPGFSQINGEYIMNYSPQAALNGGMSTDEIAVKQAAMIQEALDNAAE